MKRTTTVLTTTTTTTIKKSKLLVPKVRIGYACQNWTLRNCKPSVFAARTMTLKQFRKDPENNIKIAQERAKQNIQDLYKMIQWNAEHRIFFMRVSSNLFPLYTHPEADYDLSQFKEELEKCGRLAEETGQRLTMHPSQMNVLSSKSDSVTKKTLVELKMHATTAKYLGNPKDLVMILHGGGVYGDKKSALKRLSKTLSEMDEEIRSLLAFENDEKSYTADDLLPVCEEFKIPFVLDFFHHKCYEERHPGVQSPIDDILPRVLKSWEACGKTPKFHLSDQGDGQLGHHGDYVEDIPQQLLDLAKQGKSFDIMIEAKRKELAAAKLINKYCEELELTPIPITPPPAKKKVQRRTKKKIEVKEETEEDGEEAADTKKKRTPAKRKTRKTAKAKVAKRSLSSASKKKKSQRDEQSDEESADESASNTQTKIFQTNSKNKKRKSVEKEESEDVDELALEKEILKKERLITKEEKFDHDNELEIDPSYAEITLKH